MKKVVIISAMSLLAVGLILGRYIGRWITNKVDNPNTSINNGKPFANTYIANCDTLHLSLGNFKHTTRYFEVQAKENYLNDGNIAVVNQFNVTFKDPARQKVFNIYYFFHNSFFYSAYGTFILSNIHAEGENIIGMVNKSELNDPTYGTEAKPIPIIYFDAPGVANSFYSLVAGDPSDKTAFHGNEAAFKKFMIEYNAWHYLSYIKNKVEFEQMFGSNSANKKL
jgi:hypothetical protein